MDEDAHQGHQSGVAQQLYPPPPPYFRLAESGALKPPPLIEGQYQMFGEIYSTEDGLPGLQVRKLYEVRPDGSIDIKGQLLALHRELTVNILELLDVLVERPSGYARQVENVGLVLRNMMYLSNQLRPMQARAALAQARRHDEVAREAAAQRLQQATAAGKEAVIEAVELLEKAAKGHPP